MKLAKIEHYRCDDYDATTYVMVPDDMSHHDFVKAVDSARSAYLAVVNEWESRKEEEHRYPGFSPDYKSFPEKTVAEVDAMHAIKKAEYKEWENTRSKACKEFASYLRPFGMVPIYDYETDFETDVSWGHRHGVHLECSTTKLNDLKGPALLDPPKLNAKRI